MLPIMLLQVSFSSCRISKSKCSEVNLLHLLPLLRGWVLDRLDILRLLHNSLPLYSLSRQCPPQVLSLPWLPAPTGLTLTVLSSVPSGRINLFQAIILVESAPQPWTTVWTTRNVICDNHACCAFSDGWKRLLSTLVSALHRIDASAYSQLQLRGMFEQS